MWSSSDFQYGSRSSRSTAGLLTVVSDRTGRAFNMSGATRAVILDISKAFDRVWHAGLLHKPKSYGVSGQVSGLISSFPSNRRLRVVLNGILHKNIQLMLEFLKAQGSYYTLMTFPTMLSVISLSMLMILLSILSVTGNLIRGSNLNWPLNLNLIYETLWTGVKRGLLILMLGKPSWFHLTSLTTMVLLMSKWISLFLRKSHLLRCWG